MKLKRFRGSMTGVRSLRRAGGFSLLEVLIALVILSIGLLGVAGMQYASLRANHHAYLRSQATFLAYDIVDRMRANTAAALAGAYNLGEDDVLGPMSATVAAQDVAEWQELLSTVLPDGTGQIQVDPATRRVRVVVSWNERALGPEPGAGEPLRFDMSTDL
ncbi:MAG TPA: type IV pilus modification protein PilV [Xanthomonadaceae bacterium]|nr:type IV pilus modification protein PilV [Xanthomonadaceae bacterium]